MCSCSVLLTSQWMCALLQHTVNSSLSNSTLPSQHTVITICKQLLTGSARYTSTSNTGASAQCTRRSQLVCVLKVLYCIHCVQDMYILRCTAFGRIHILRILHSGGYIYSAVLHILHSGGYMYFVYCIQEDICTSYTTYNVFRR